MGFWHVYMGIEGGGSVTAVAVDYVTTRLTLIGTSLYRVSLDGTSEQRITLIGSSQ